MPVDDDDRTLLPSGAHSAKGAPPSEHNRKNPPVVAPNARQQTVDADGVSLPAGYRLHEFEVQSKLGQGGFCIVYKAFDHQLKRVVALKEYMPNGMARRVGNSEVLPQSPRSQEVFDIGLNSFVKEGVTLAKFDHPALVRVYRTFQANGTAYMIMQLVQGKTLEEVARAMPAPPDEAWLLRLLDPLTAALQVVHDERIVHRDIAPDNVMILDGTNQPLLLDFGAARQVIGDSEQAPTAMLKPSYAPIEQYPDSGQPQGAWTDVYALAGVVHRLITGKAPPNSQGRVLKDAYVPLTGRVTGKYSARFLKAVDHALKLSPAERTQSIPAFRQELGLDDPARGVVGPAGGGVAPSKRVPIAVWAIAAAGVMGVVGLVVYKLAAAPESPSKPGILVAEPAKTPAAAPSRVLNVVVPASQAPLAPVVSDPPVPSALDPSIEFDRVVQQQSPAIQTTLTVAKPSIRVNRDPLRMQLTANRAGYFYVLIHDTDRQVRMLFPNFADTENRIAAGQSVELPHRTTDAETGLSKSVDLRFSDPAGPARLLAIVSSQPLDFTAVTKSQDGEYRVLLQGPEAGLAQAAAPERPLYLGRVQCEPAGSRCSSEYGAASAAITVTP